MSLLSRRKAACLVSGVLVWGSLAGAGCSQATQTYALTVPGSRSGAAPSERAGTANTVGSLSVERIEGGQNLVVLQLEQLPPPERLGTGLHAFVVWLEDPRGGEVNVGTLHYDRAHRSGNLLATTELMAFTVRVTGERDGLSDAPSGVLLAERRVATN